MLGAALLHNLDGSYSDTNDIPAIKLLQDSPQGAVEDHEEGQNRDKADERPDDCYELDPPHYFHPHTMCVYMRGHIHCQSNRLGK